MADGIISVAPGPSVGVFVADCLPVLLWDDTGRAVGAVHAGWRGLAAGVLQAAVDSFDGIGVAPGSLRAAVGPHIGPCCYRVGPELRPLFRTGSFSTGSFSESGGLRLDLGAEARSRLIEAGVSAGCVAVSEDCTACREEDFFSFRRDKIRRSMLALIAPVGTRPGGMRA
ncbi:MAG: polyphenol oxidase family protein [Elusimicrobiota bacterium]